MILGNENPYLGNYPKYPVKLGKSYFYHIFISKAFDEIFKASYHNIKNELRKSAKATTHK